MLDDILNPRGTSRNKKNQRNNNRALFLFAAAGVAVALCWLVSLWTLQGSNDPLDSETWQQLMTDLSSNSRSGSTVNNNNKPLVSQCSQAQRQAIFDLFNRNLKNIRGTALNTHTKCPDEPWLELYFGQRVQPNYLAVNVGCNKGTDAVHMARILSRDEEFSARKWLGRMEFKQGTVCGTPSDHPILPHVTPGDATGIAPSTGKVHCLEAIPATYQALQAALSKSGQKHQQTLVLKQGAVSNTSGKALFPSGFVGAEAFSLGNCMAGDHEVNSKDKAGNCTEVEMMSLDGYMREQQALGNAGTSPQQPIDMLLIDVEGFDYEVLQGGTESIKRARYLSFEVHFQGTWPSHSLMHVVDNMLDNFVCYWVGKAKLWRITDCVDEQLVNLYENYKSWSNVACASKSEPKLVGIMEHIFQYNTLGILSEDY